MALNTGKYLKINLSNAKTVEEVVPQQVAADFVGGRGYGIKFLYDELSPNVDPLGEDNKLLLVAGPLAGTSAVAVSRWMSVTKSPLTGAFARSVCGADLITPFIKLTSRQRNTRIQHRRDHIHPRNIRNDALPQIRPHIHHSPHQQTSCTSSHGKHLLRTRELLLNQIFPAIDKIIKSVLLLEQPAIIIPLPPHLTASPDVGDRQYEAPIKQA